MDKDSLYQIARDDFRRARRLAVLREISARLRGKPTSLLPFEEVRTKLRASGEEPRGLQTIPLDSIIGSVGRYTDFTRDFLPKRDSTANRWVRVRTAFRNSSIIPPIQVYKIGDVYFVLDGNHRVSVARNRNLKEIRGYVTEIHTKVGITADTDYNDLILKEEYSNFLNHSQLDTTCPNIDFTVTAPGQYQIFEDQIELKRQEKENKEKKEISFPEAAHNWCIENYLPIIEFIRERGVLRDFPKRTETDLFAWILRHQEKLHVDTGWNLEPSVVATDITDRYSKSPYKVFSRFSDKLQSYIIPGIFKIGPRPGKFRVRQRLVHAHDPSHLFTHMLVPISGETDSWKALDLGLRLAWREEAHLLGLHIISSNGDRYSPNIQAIQNKFAKKCKDAGLPGELAIDSGSIVQLICKHARLSDLVIINLAHPPESHPIMRAGSGIRKLIHQSPRPILTIPQVPEKIDQLLVAYNGSPRSREALYAAAYFAGRWEANLYVLTISEPGKVKQKIINHARYYLRSRQIQAIYLQKRGQIADIILAVQKEYNSSIIFMGGYSKPPVIDVVVESPLDKVLRESSVPVLICH